MMRGDFPRLHRQSRQSREVLQQLRYRQRLVKMRTMTINTLRFMAMSRGVSVRGHLSSHVSQERMKAVPLTLVLSQQRDELLSLVRDLTLKIGRAQQWLEEQARQDPQVRLLVTHPGLGPLTALCLVHTLSPINRFRNGRKVTGYAGLDPTEHSSAERQRFGSISKQGSRLLRFLLVEAGQVAARQDHDLKQLYGRVQLRRNRPKAKVAVARRLLVRAFIMLRDQIDYAEFLRRGVAARSARTSP
jgi:transposase